MTFLYKLAFIAYLFMHFLVSTLCLTEAGYIRFLFSSLLVAVQ